MKKKNKTDEIRTGFMAWFGKDADNCTYELFDNLNDAKRWIKAAKQSELFKLCRYHNTGIKKVKIKKCAMEWCDALTSDELIYCPRCEKLICDAMVRC